MTSNESEKKQNDENCQVKFSIEKLENMFENNLDVLLHEYLFEKHKVTFLFCEGMIDQKVFNESIYGRFVDFFKHLRKKRLTEELISESLYVPDLKRL